ncbi:MAG: ABC transporter permease subunit [Actinomycetota bacterium]
MFLKTIRDHWRGWLIAWVSLVVLLLMVMAVYREIDLSLYTSLPDVYRSMLGIPDAADVASLSVRSLLGTYGALVIASMALAFGAGSIAGEERAGTLGLLLANPRSRTHVLVAKLAALAVLPAVCVFALWGSVVASAALLDVSIEGMDVGALCLHLVANSLFFGLLAAAVGAWTGSRGSALGVSIGVMVLSFVGVGVLPLVEGLEEWVRVLPWHYFSGSDPLLSGVAWGDLGILLTGSAALTGAAVAGLNRRDLKGQVSGGTLLDRLRQTPLIERAIGRLGGTARVSSIWLKTASEYQVHLLITAVYMFTVQGLMMGALYAAIPVDVRAAADSAFAAMPEAVLALFGGGGMGDPEGFYQIETFGMVAPIAVMIVAVAIGAGALAGEESRRTMGLLLANPITRSRVVGAKTVTMVLYSFAIGAVTFAGVAAGVAAGGLGMDYGNIAAASLLQTLVGLVFGGLALALSAGTGHRKLAIWGAVGAALFFHVFNSLSGITEWLADWAWISPFHFSIGNDPLRNGMDWGNAAVLAVISAVLVGVSAPLFQRRDLRQGGE